MDPKQVPSEPPPDYTASAAEHDIKLRQSVPAVRPGAAPFELPVISYLKSRRVILASASPRRRALLAQVGLTNVEIIPSRKPENLSKTNHTPFEYVSATAHQKCLDVYQAAVEAHNAAVSAGGEGGGAPAEPELVIAADTIIVTRDGRVLEKPRSENDHFKMLRHLRDTEVHQVLTAVCVLAPKADATHPGYVMAAHTEETKVYFAQESNGLPDDVIRSYVRTREGADKAGGYAVQGLGGLVLVEKVEGNFDNVVGLPVRKCLQLIEKVVFRQGEEHDKAAGGDEGSEDEAY